MIVIVDITGFFYLFIFTVAGTIVWVIYTYVAQYISTYVWGIFCIMLIIWLFK